MEAMLNWFMTEAAGISLGAVVFKLFLSVILSGLIGLERGTHKHTAGFRTHMLVCLGACVAMMTDQYIVTYISSTADPARLGAQVITGVGFLGAGTIVLAGRQIRGLTTAAGLWASACLGLAVGIGFFSAAIVATALIIIVLALFPKLESRIYASASSIALHIEIDKATNFMDFIKHLKEQEIPSFTTTISKTPALVQGGISFRLMIEHHSRIDREELFGKIRAFEGVYLIEEL